MWGAADEQFIHPMPGQIQMQAQALVRTPPCPRLAFYVLAAELTGVAQVQHAALPRRGQSKGCRDGKRPFCSMAVRAVGGYLRVERGEGGYGQLGAR